MEILEAYRKECPDVFARLPLPKHIAEKLGCPIKAETVSLNEYMKAFMQTQYSAKVDVVEEKVACEIKPSDGPLIPPDYIPVKPGRIDEEEEKPQEDKVDPDMPELEPDTADYLQQTIDEISKSLSKVENAQ